MGVTYVEWVVVTEMNMVKEMENGTGEKQMEIDSFRMSPNF